MAFLSVLLATSLVTNIPVARSAVIRTAADLNTCVYDTPGVGTPFDFEATLIDKSQINLTFTDGSGSAYASFYEPEIRDLEAENGDIVRICGQIEYLESILRAIAVCTNLTVIRHGPPVLPIRTTVREALSGRFDFRPITLSGTIRDICVDQIDTANEFLLLESDGATIPLAILKFQSHLRPIVRQLTIGTPVEVSGLCNFGDNSFRRIPGRMIRSITSFRITAPPPENPFDVPELGDLRRAQPTEVSALGRHRIRGHVLAVCKGNRFVVRTADRLLHTVTAASDRMPTYGDPVTAVGYPETDLFNINLTHAIWRRDGDPLTTPEEATDISAREILYDRDGKPCFKVQFHGRPIRLLGIVQDRHASEILLKCDGVSVTVDATSVPGILSALEPASEISVAGICVMDIERWHPNNAYAQIRGFSLVPRSPDDIRVIARPPWWTPLRLLTAIGILLALLAAFAVWNVLLKRAAERRGRELADERVAHVETELKVYERTRLAVELHDALSQNLAGISFEIDAAERLSLTDGQATQRHLAVASRTLDSCRNELKNCLWDLRNNALEDAEMDTAIRRTLAPVLGEESVAIRFAVPRDRLTDATAHAILCIVRELTVNAIRHGKASRILVAGSFEDGLLKFSVKDNGCGFDPDLAPSAQDGHYGLLGIRERVESHEGTFLLESAPGKGCKVSVTLKAPDEE